MISYYRRIANDIRNKINNNEYKSGELLPKHIELAKTYDTSRVTISKALAILKLEELVYTKKGIGTFVNEPYTIYDTKFIGFTTKMKGSKKPKSKIISFDVRFPNEIEQKKLHLSKDEPVYDIIRLRLKDEPLLLEYTIMPIKVIPGITESILLKSIYQYIQNVLNFEVGASTRVIRADRPDAYDQKFLNCSVYDPVLEIDQVVYLSDGRPFEYSQTRRRYDKGDCTIASI